MEGIVHKIHKLYEAKGLGPTEFAKKIGVHRDTVYKWTDESIKVSTLVKICQTFKIPIEKFLTADVRALHQVSEPLAKYGKDDCQETRKQNEFYKAQYDTDRTTIKALHQLIDVLNEQLHPKPEKHETTKTRK